MILSTTCEHAPSHRTGVDSTNGMKGRRCWLPGDLPRIWTIQPPEIAADCKEVRPVWSLPETDAGWLQGVLNTTHLIDLYSTRSYVIIIIIYDHYLLKPNTQDPSSSPFPSPKKNQEEPTPAAFTRNFAASSASPPYDKCAITSPPSRQTGSPCAQNSFLFESSNFPTLCILNGSPNSTAAVIWPASSELAALCTTIEPWE